MKIISSHIIHCIVAAALVASAVAAADVRSHGANGGGQVDDTAAIQRAVDAGGSVQFPTGTYRITHTITIDLDKTGFIALTADGTARIVMAGPGPAFQFIGTHAGSAAPRQFRPNVWERQRMPSVAGLEILGAHPEADGIAAKGTMQLTLTRLLIRETRHAIRLHERNRNVLISDCHLYHNRGVGVFLDAVNLHQINVTGSHISYNTGGGVVVRGGQVRNLHIGNCDIESNMSADAPATVNVLLDSTGGTIGEVAITGCTIQHNSLTPDTVNIRVIGAPEEEGNNLTISGNILSDVQVNVHLRDANGVTLTGNTFWMGYQHDILIEDSSNIVVGPNNLHRPGLQGERARTRGGVVFRRSRDCTITGLHVNGVREHAAAVLLEQCHRFNVTGASILDSDGSGLKVTNSTLMRVTGCVIRDDRPEPNPAPALLVSGGHGNRIVDNSLDRPAEIAPGSGTDRDNEVVPKTTGR